MTLSEYLVRVNSWFKSVVIMKGHVKIFPSDWICTIYINSLLYCKSDSAAMNYRNNSPLSINLTLWSVNKEGFCWVERKVLFDKVGRGSFDRGECILFVFSGISCAYSSKLEDQHLDWLHHLIAEELCNHKIKLRNIKQPSLRSYYQQVWISSLFYREHSMSLEAFGWLRKCEYFTTSKCIENKIFKTLPLGEQGDIAISSWICKLKLMILPI
jgi:hypothetical protein